LGKYCKFEKKINIIFEELKKILKFYLKFNIYFNRDYEIPNIDGTNLIKGKAFLEYALISQA
jgi:hypothetical protein